jgi:hypothetical protein
MAWAAASGEWSAASSLANRRTMAGNADEIGHLKQRTAAARRRHGDQNGIGFCPSALCMGVPCLTGTRSTPPLRVMRAVAR